eukprot:10810540-Lingulodinium_polyedra.AAC.1
MAGRLPAHQRLPRPERLAQGARGQAQHQGRHDPVVAELVRVARDGGPHVPGLRHHGVVQHSLRRCYAMACEGWGSRPLERVGQLEPVLATESNDCVTALNVPWQLSPGTLPLASVAGDFWDPRLHLNLAVHCGKHVLPPAAHGQADHPLQLSEAPCMLAPRRVGPR